MLSLLVPSIDQLIMWVVKCIQVSPSPVIMLSLQEFTTDQHVGYVMITGPAKSRDHVETARDHHWSADHVGYVMITGPTESRGHVETARDHHWSADHDSHVIITGPAKSCGHVETARVHQWWANHVSHVMITGPAESRDHVEPAGAQHWPSAADQDQQQGRLSIDIRCCYTTVDSVTPVSSNGASFYSVFLNRARD
jgi:hypothetical protein